MCSKTHAVFGTTHVKSSLQPRDGSADCDPGKSETAESSSEK